MTTLTEWDHEGIRYRVCKGQHSGHYLETTKETPTCKDSRLDDITPSLADALVKMVAALKASTVPATTQGALAVPKSRTRNKTLGGGTHRPG